MASISEDATASTSVPTELVIIINPHNLNYSEFIGSRAMLEAEGVIPDDTKWPEGFDDLRWEAGEFWYWLRRKRPKRPRSARGSFRDCDWWCLRWELINAPKWAELAIMHKTQALKDEIYRHSAEGVAEFEKFRRTKYDEKFQAFKALIPCLTRPKPGRRPKNAEQSKSVSA